MAGREQRLWRLGEAVVGGKDLTSAVVGVFEELQTAPGQVVPIGMLEDVNRKEVSIERSCYGTLGERLAGHSTSRTHRRRKWENENYGLGKSNQPWIEEGESMFEFTEQRRTGTTGASQ